MYMVGSGKKRVPTNYIALIKDMYDDGVTSIRACEGVTNGFPNIQRFPNFIKKWTIIKRLLQKTIINIKINKVWLMWKVILQNQLFLTHNQNH